MNEDSDPMVIGQPAGQPLATMLLRLIEGDDELREQLDEARRRNLPRLAVVKLAPLIAPSTFTQASLASFGERTSAPQWRVGTIDPWREWLALNIRRRVAEIITAVFDELRRAELTAIGFVPATGARMCVPTELWGSEAVTFDMRAGGLVAGATAVFLGIQVQAAAQVRTASRSAIGQFVAHFDAAMQAADRRFTVDEIIAAARAALGNVSGPEVEAALRRSPVSARAGAGRRAAHEVPTEAELAAAAATARQVAE